MVKLVRSEPPTPSPMISPNEAPYTHITPKEVYGDFFAALQSASYVIVIVSGFLLWNSKKWFHDLVAKHFSMIESLQRESRANLQLTVEQHKTIAQLTKNNNVLSRVVSQHLKGVELFTIEDDTNE